MLKLFPEVSAGVELPQGVAVLTVEVEERELAQLEDLGHELLYQHIAGPDYRLYR